MPASLILILQERSTKLPDRTDGVVFSCNLMIRTLSHNGRIKEPRQLFDKMNEHDVFTWTAMDIPQNERIDDARRLFDKMPEKNGVSSTVMITEYVQNGRLENARQLFKQMPVRNSIPKRNAISWTAMITGDAQNGKIENARQLFDRIPKRDVNARTKCGILECIIAGYVPNGYGEESLKLFTEMLRSGSKPNQSTFTSFLSACASLEAMQLVKQVQKHITKMGFDSDMLLGMRLLPCMKLDHYAGLDSMSRDYCIAHYAVWLTFLVAADM
eukprot:Gb_13693 [translate_table: standard]